MPKSREMRVWVVSLAALATIASVNGLIDAGAMLHTLFCSTHGILI